MYTSTDPDNRSGMNIEATSLINKQHKPIKNKRWSNLQLIIFILITATVTALLSNIDRIIEWMNDDENSNDQFNTNQNYDVIIVGGGISGLTAMNIFSNFENINDNKQNVILIEKLPRLGGRSYSPKITFNDKSVYIETGAMRLDYNPLQWKMFHYLDLCQDLLQMHDYNNQTYDSNRLERGYLDKSNGFNRRNIFNFNAFDEEVLYNNALGGNLLYSLVWTDIINENNNGNFTLTDEDWKAFWYNWTLNGVSIYKWSFHTMYRYYINHLIPNITERTSIEYYNSMLRGWYDEDGSIAWRLKERYAPYLWQQPQNLTQLYANVPRSVLKRGLGSVPYRLYETLPNNDKEKVLLSTEMIGIDYSDDDYYKYEMKVLQTDTNEIDYIYANKIILSIPGMDLLNKLPFMTPIDTESTFNLFNAVHYVDINKINFIYDTSVDQEFWNENLQNILTLSRSSTDEEITEIYVEKSWMNDTLFFIHFYGMGTKSNLFNKLQIMGDLYPINENIQVNADGLLTCSIFLVEEILAQFRSLTNMSNIPYPLGCFNNPMGVNKSHVAGLNEEWKFDSNILDITSKIERPVNDEDIYVAISDYVFGAGGTSGMHWQWGAFKAAIDVLVKYFSFDDNPFYDEFYPQCPPDTL